MPVRRPLAASLVLLAALALPPLLGLAAHELAHHGHGEETGADGADGSGLGRMLVHGHGHAAEVPDHDHHLLPAPPLRPLAPPDLLAPVPALRAAPGAGRLPMPDARPWAWSRPEPSGSGPPRLQLLCALLI
ncbi:MAG TPA: hypothetical protein VEG34_05980 [Thermoanaerobaculia bacterium]|nr:hypothetical protein [Thermoanaerobaculia bacterium]